jgi:hypothetical protein
MIWVEPVRETRKPTDILETVKKAEKKVSEFQMYLDNKLGKIRREENNALGK